MYATTDSGNSIKTANPAKPIKPTEPTTLALGLAPFLSQAGDLGKGFDIYGAFRERSMLVQLLDYSQVGTQVFSFLGKNYLIPANVTAVANASVDHSSGVYQSRNALQNSFADHAGVSSDAGAFEGQLRVAYGSQFQNNADYAYNNTFMPLATLTHNPGADALQSGFQRRVDALPGTLSGATFAAFSDFFDDFGVYYVQSISLGALVEFYVGVGTASGLSADSISAALNTHWNGLFVSGSFQPGVPGWDAYQANSGTNIIVHGGDAALASRLQAIGSSPFSAGSGTTVAAFNDFAISIAGNPAVIDFALSGIWDFCGAKSELVRQAWAMYADSMSVRVALATQSVQANDPRTGTIVTPSIFLQGESMKPAAPPASMSGLQIIVLNGNGQEPLENQVLLNKYYSFQIPPTGNVWQGSYAAVYAEAVSDLSAAALRQRGNILILSTFGMDLNMGPTADMREQLQFWGAGGQLDGWLAQSEPGKQVYDYLWVDGMGNYMLAGIYGNGPGSGIEFYNGLLNRPSLRTSGSVSIYWDSDAGRYMLNAGG